MAFVDAAGEKLVRLAQLRRIYRTIYSLAIELILNTCKMDLVKNYFQNTQAFSVDRLYLK